MAAEQPSTSELPTALTTATSLPITLAGIPMGTTAPGQQSFQFTTLRPSSGPRILPAHPQTLSQTFRLASPSRNGQLHTVVTAGGETQQIYLISATPTDKTDKTDKTGNKNRPAGTSTTGRAPRGRRRMTDEEKALAKKQREQAKNPNQNGTGPGTGSGTGLGTGLGTGSVKRKPGRPFKKNQPNPANDFTAEINDLRQKVHGRFHTQRKANIKKEDVGYFGPYVRTYVHTNQNDVRTNVHTNERTNERTNHQDDEKNSSSVGGGRSRVPLPNFIVDTFEAHLDLPDASKSRYKLEKPSVVLEGPFVCHFCHLDPSAEREISMGDLIGPIPFPTGKGGGRGTLVKRPGGEEEPAGFYTHQKCLEWASNFRMVGYDIVELENILEDAKTKCSICHRKGATIGCSAPVSCKKAFHYPCAKNGGYKLVPSSHQVFCEDHQNVFGKKQKSKTLKMKEEFFLATE